MKRKRVLVAPLDWGLGHATRCIPIVERFLQQNCDVLLAGCDSSLEILKQHFPQLPFFVLPSYNPYYSKGSFMVFAMLRQLPKFIRAIKTEHRVVEKLILDQKIDLVVSDNRFGCWSANAKSIFITHQVTILMPSGWQVMAPLVNYFNRKQIQRFDACWIPDFSNHMLSGKLTITNLPVCYIGPLSRFSVPSLRQERYDILILLSGPEPQRTVLEQIMIRSFEKTKLNVLLVRGKYGRDRCATSSNFNVIDFLYTDELKETIENASLVICRSGYSTIMDLAKLKRRAFFIPTPGQSEQEYLAVRLKEMGIASFVKQDSFDTDDIFRLSENYKGFVDVEFDQSLLDQAIVEALK